MSVTATNGGGATSASVVITEVESGDVASRDLTSRDVTRDEPVTTVADDGTSTTRTTTTLTDSEGNVDVSIDILGTSYDEYAYLMEIYGSLNG